MDVYGTLDPDTKRIDAIGRPAYGYVRMKDADNDGAIDGIDAKGHHVDSEADTCIPRSRD